MPVDEFQFLCHVHISVQVNIAVGRMIIRSVEIKEFFITKVRNILRSSAGFTSISDIREQRVHDLTLQNIIRRRKSSLHFVINNTIIGQRAFWFFQMIIPAFLTEDFFFLINVRIKNCIQINMHQILEILIITACHRITGLVRISHGIQKSVQRAFDQFDKRIFERKLSGSAEHAVFQNMCNTCAVLRRGTKSDIEHFVFVIVLNEHYPCSGSDVPEQVACRTDVS